jgi:serine/threonine protein kinase
MQTIGRYVIDARIGSGGLGVIYRARDPQLGRDVAIKVMSAGSAAEADLLARFEREARTAAALAHRNIVTIHEFGIHDGAPFIVMELLGGTDLDGRLLAGGMSTREKLSVAVQIAEALAFAHGRGVVHRDLKPSNVRILPDGTVKLMDFGLAYVPASTLTRTGELFGTVAFLAPEQLRGSKGDPRSDIFSLGVLMFEMFEGRLPFEGDSSPDLIRHILERPPRDAQWLPRHPELHGIVLRALEKEPARRWQSAAEVVEALTALVIPSEVDGPGVSDRAPHPPVSLDFAGYDTARSITAPIFTPGTVAGGRYRIVALLGRGGMGEVYRADDLRLGQRVALKFLAPHLAADPARLERLYAEVRVGRQVSHPNVCRIYDIGDAGGHPFIAMQFVEGEDLASLLRRVGRLSLEKSLDIARDICSGLAAAHAAGVIHRDLKPSNIMIDAQGRAILLDFGLASVGADDASRPSGSLHYASPEQLAGRGVSIASDLYSLGLVLYELLTSRRAFEGETLAEVSAARASHRITAPSIARPDIPSALDRMIVRCLSIDPAERPASAREILAVLPGGDAVTAAIAAGETPSPDVIAAAGGAGDLTRGQAWSALAVVAALAVLLALVAPLAFVHLVAPFDQRPEVLAANADAIAEKAGYYAMDGDSTYTLVPDEDYLEWLKDYDPDWAATVAKPWPPAIHLVWRWSPRPLQSRTLALLGRVHGNEPPLDVPGMLLVETGSTGQLMRFVAVPPRATDPAKPRPAVDWSPLLAATGCRAVSEIAPEWTPPVASDARRAWRCGDHRIEAASYAGKPVWFEVIGTWRNPDAVAPRRDVRALSDDVYRLIVLGVIVGAGAVARRNIARGRGDRRRAFRVALVVTAGSFLEWLIATRHVGSLGREWELFVGATGRALFFGGLAWVVYMAAEPYVRRQWPRLVTAWYRFFDGRFRDPLVGRDVLLGVAGGALLQLTERGMNALAAWRDAAPPILYWVQIPHFTRVADAVALLFRFPNRAVWNALGSLIVLLLLRAIVRNRIVAAVLWIAVITAMNLNVGPSLVMEISFTLLFVVILLAILLRIGLFALAVALLTHYTFGYFVPVFDFSTWYAWRTLLGWAVVTALAAYGFFVSLGGKRPLGRSILDE